MRKFAPLAVALFAVLIGTISMTAPAHATPQTNTKSVHQTAKSVKKPAEKVSKKMYTVKKGDMLSKIAKHYHTTYVRLFNANPSIKDPDVINPGDKIRIPNKDEKLAARPLPEAAAPVSAPAPATTYVPATTTYRARTTAAPAPAVASGSVWDRLAQCESGGNWAINTGNGFYGGLQFTLNTWRGYGGTGMPQNASRAQQIAVAKRVLAAQGWGAWPACSAKLGLR